MGKEKANEIVGKLRSQLDAMNLSRQERRAISDLVVALCRALMEETADYSLALFEAERLKG